MLTEKNLEALKSHGIKLSVTEAKTKSPNWEAYIYVGKDDKPLDTINRFHKHFKNNVKPVLEKAIKDFEDALSDKLEKGESLTPKDADGEALTTTMKSIYNAISAIHRYK